MSCEDCERSDDAGASGVFTFSNRLGLNQQDVIADTCAVASAPYGRVIIPHELKVQFSMRLSLMNVTAATLFPGLEGVSTSIRDWLRHVADPVPTQAVPQGMPENLQARAPG